MAIETVTLKQQLQFVQVWTDKARKDMPGMVARHEIKPEQATRQLAILEALELTLQGKEATGTLPPAQVVQGTLF